MRSLKSGLFGCVVAGLVGTFAVVGCSASGDTGIDPATETDPTEGSSVLPPSSAGDGEDEETPAVDGGTKSSTKDAGSKDAAKDSGPPPPAPGDACTTVDQKFKKSCGKCGWQEAICLASGGGTGGTVSDYGTCQGEIGQCTPGDTEACGNCGTRTCSNSCNWSTCGGQPTNSCSPGTVDHSTAGCTTANTFRKRTCGTACTWGSYEASCESPSLTVSGTVGQVSAGQWALSSAMTTKRPTGTCPTSSVTTTQYPFFAVPVTNNTGKAATVQIYHSGTPALDTLLWVYNRSTLPTTDDELKQCVGTVADNCNALQDACGNASSGGSSYDWAGLDNVSIPAGATIMVYSAGYGPSEVGNFTLNVKTKTLN